MLGRLDIYQLNFEKLMSESSQYQNPLLQIFPKGSNKKSVIAFSVCPTKSLVACIFQDKIIKFWFYEPKQ